MGPSHSSPPSLPLLNHGGNLEEQLNPPAPAENGNVQKKVALLPLIFLIFFEVSGGPYGEESVVGAAGPLFAILGFLIFPFVWSIPEALITAELATLFPGNGGFVIWAHEAFGPFCGSMMGSWKLLSGVINLASYPVLCVDYLKLIFPILSHGIPRYVVIFASTLCLSFLNYIGLVIVGYVGVCIGFLSLSPFVVITAFSIPKIKPSRWMSLGNNPKKNWPLYFNTLFWNLNSWDNASTLAGEVENPQKTIPKALLSAVILTCLAYLFPLMAATGATPLDDQSKWTEGYFADLAEMIGGSWLKYWMDIGSVLSVIGLYEAQLSCCAYQILGMSDIGVLPKAIGCKSKWFDTPVFGILLPTIVALGVCFLDFTEIISAVNLLYSLGMLLEFGAFLYLRKKMGNLFRPYKVPMEMPGLIIMCLIPTVFLVYLMFIGTHIVYAITGSLTLCGVVWYFLMNLCRSKKWFEFNSY